MSWHILNLAILFGTYKAKLTCPEMNSATWYILQQPDFQSLVIL